MTRDTPAPIPDAASLLTEKEKEVLRPWLEHSTAKEIALALGVSHHAVEKRLKSARARLGVASSLDAARALARAEGGQGYGQPASRPPDLDMHRDTGDQPGITAAGRAGTPDRDMRRSPLVSGVIAMSVIIASALAIALSGATADPAPAPAAKPPAVTVKRFGVGGDATQADLRRAFAALDRDKSGFLEEAELGALSVMRLDGKGTSEGGAKTSALDLFDGNKDRRISLAEFERAVGAAKG